MMGSSVVTYLLARQARKQAHPGTHGPVDAHVTPNTPLLVSALESVSVDLDKHMRHTHMILDWEQHTVQCLDCSNVLR